MALIRYGLSGVHVTIGLNGVCFLIFFFSSRRRHTRCSRDWSSDVCSSDLPDYFAKKFRNIPHFKSCEDIAKEACHEFCQAVGKEGGRCRRVTVSISGIPGSWITADMYQGGGILTSAALA